MPTTIKHAGVALLTTALALGVVLATGSAIAEDEGLSTNLRNARSTIPTNMITIDCQNLNAKMGIESTGNIIQFESPMGYEHIGVGAFSEGYVFSYNDGMVTKLVYDVGPSPFDESGWGPPAYVPGGNFVDRYTLDGKVKLTQIFKPLCATRKLLVQNKLYNMGSVALNDTCFARQVDLDIDTGGALGWAQFVNNHAASQDAYVAWNDKGDAPDDRLSHSMHLSKVGGHFNSVAKVTDDILDTTCPAVDVAEDDPRLGFDDGGRIEVYRTLIAPGQGVSMLVEYQRD